MLFRSHAVSAFCNAGISTLSGNMYDPLVADKYNLHFWIAMLIIFGAVNVLGLINKNPQKTMQGSRRIIQSFKEQNGTVICKELKGINDGIVKRECIDCVRDAAALLEAELPEM